MSDTVAAEPAAVTPDDADERLAYRGVFQRLFIRPEIGAMIGAVGIWVFFWAVAIPFGTANGTAGILDVAATLGIMAVAVSMLMIGGEFDLSSGANTGAMGILMILLVKETGDLGGAGLSLWLAIPISFLVAMGIGYFNGWMVEKTALPSFIITLATFFVLRGAKLGFSKLIVDQIQVGRTDEGQGYDFWRPIFAAPTSMPRICGWQTSPRHGCARPSSPRRICSRPGSSGRISPRRTCPAATASSASFWTR